MLPMCRTPGDVYTLPQFDVSPSEVEGFLDELRALAKRNAGVAH